MKTIVEFGKTTLIGGLLIGMPAYLTLLLLAKALLGMVELLGPIVALLPGDQHFRQLMATALVVLFCFILGVVARTGLGRRVIVAFERRMLERLPGFTTLRPVVRRISGSSDDAQFQPVLVEIDEVLTPAFIVEETGAGRFVVLVPSLPTPAAGSLYILPRQRVHWVDAPVTEAVAVITRRGTRTSKLLKARRGTAAWGLDDRPLLDDETRKAHVPLRRYRAALRRFAAGETSPAGQMSELAAGS